MTDPHYDTSISTSVRLTGTNKLFRITQRKMGDVLVPYVTYQRRTRVLFKNPVGGAYINLHGSRVYFQ